MTKIIPPLEPTKNISESMPANVIVCPICKKTVKVGRHNQQLCEEICRRQLIVSKAAKDAFRKTDRINQ